MIPTKCIVLDRDIVDGTSNVIAVGECSDYAIDANGFEINIQGTHGWLMGSPVNAENANGERMFNLTFINHPPNWVKVQGNIQPATPGIGTNFGSNNGLYSPHTGGTQAAMADGSVRVISDNVDMLTLRRAATRDDQGELGDF
ncbi:MAG: DUF1559 domain-containing protein [Rhodopirellula sp.]|nr:DUF1559 domain-containing protein [Rhodopirellula sp.]